MKIKTILSCGKCHKIIKKDNKLHMCNKCLLEEYKNDIDWIISECWELINKPHRLFNSLRNIILKYGDLEDSENKESLKELDKIYNGKKDTLLCRLMKKL